MIKTWNFCKNAILAHFYSPFYSSSLRMKMFKASSLVIRQISKRVLKENEVRQIFPKTNISYPLIRTFTCPSKKCLIFGKFDVLCFSVTPVSDSPFCRIADELSCDKRNIARKTEQSKIANKTITVYFIWSLFYTIPVHFYESIKFFLEYCLVTKTFLSWNKYIARCWLAYRNQSFDLQCRSNEWFLYEIQRWVDWVDFARLKWKNWNEKKYYAHDNQFDTLLIISISYTHENFTSVKYILCLHSSLWWNRNILN